MTHTVPNILGLLVKIAKLAVEEEGLGLGLCKAVDQPQPWIDATSTTAYDDRIVEEYHQDTQAGDQLELGGTVGVMLKGGIDPEPEHGSGVQIVEPGARGVNITINVFVGADRSGDALRR